MKFNLNSFQTPPSLCSSIAIAFVISVLRFPHIICGIEIEVIDYRICTVTFGGTVACAFGLLFASCFKFKVGKYSVFLDTIDTPSAYPDLLVKFPYGSFRRTTTKYHLMLYFFMLSLTQFQYYCLKAVDTVGNYSK